ncbi:DegV family protein [Cytobacillus sp. FJAT-54145]|uniref:DegV family protein n=1 Tax=Cytobacillus spartinae TaxID=3299023 RepID=A0ABW6KDU2_9BACI
MTKRIAWVTDSTASFLEQDEQWLKENHIHVIPLYVNFGNETFKEGIDITQEQFYERMSQTNEPITSSQPALGDFINLYQSLKENYDEAIIIHVSGELSGTYSTSIQAAEMVDFPVHSVDSWIGSFPLKFMVKEGIRLYKEGFSPTEIVDKLHALREKCRLILIPANLEQLRKSGRVSNFGSILGNLLQIKPLLAFKEGKVQIVEKIRTMKKAEAALLSRLADAYRNGIYDNIGLMYAGERNSIENLLQKIKDEYNDLKIDVLPLIPVAGVHTGVGTITLAWVEKE